MIPALRPPRLWPADPGHHRRATWMELFFDLIFVAAIAQAGAPMHSEYTTGGVLRFAFMFLLIWRAWTGHTFFCTRFDTDDVLQRSMILIQCFIAAVMAANARESLDSSSSAGFGAAYAGMRIVLALQYLRASRIAEVRDLTRRYAVGIIASAILWILSAVVDLPSRYWVWAVALAADFATPWLAGRYLKRVPPDATHLPERFGLFTIILLGEFVASVMHGIETQEEWTFAAASTAFMSMAMAFVLWWWYFEGAGVASERRIRTARDVRLFHVWQLCSPSFGSGNWCHRCGCSTSHRSASRGTSAPAGVLDYELCRRTDDARARHCGSNHAEPDTRARASKVSRVSVHAGCVGRQPGRCGSDAAPQCVYRDAIGHSSGTGVAGTPPAQGRIRPIAKGSLVS
jgi:hypothetical protein